MQLLPQAHSARGTLLVSLDLASPHSQLSHVCYIALFFFVIQYKLILEVSFGISCFLGVQYDDINQNVVVNINTMSPVQRFSACKTALRMTVMAH